MEITPSFALSLPNVDENKESEEYDVESYPRLFQVKDEETAELVTYTSRPLGLDMESGDYGRNLIVTSSASVQAGSLIVQINQHPVRGMETCEIIKTLKKSKLPISIWFVTTRQERVRGLSLRIRQSKLQLDPGAIKVYLPDGTPYTTLIGRATLKALLDWVCASNALKGEMLALVMQNREDESDVRYPDMNAKAAQWSTSNSKKYRLRLIPKDKIEWCNDGAPVDGISILTRNGFDDTDIQELKSLLDSLIDLEVDATFSVLSRTLDEDFDCEMKDDDIMAVVEWHKSIVKRNALQPSGTYFIRVFFEGPARNTEDEEEVIDKTYSLRNPMLTARDVCSIISEDRGIENPEKFALYIRGNTDARDFEQEFDDGDIPLQVRESIASGLGRLQFVFKERKVESDTESESDSLEVVLSSPNNAFHIGAVEDWTDEQLQKAMQSYMEEMKLQESKTEPDQRNEEEKLSEQRRLELYKECVINRYHLAEVIENFDSKAVRDFPSYKRLQDLSVGELVIIIENDPSGWSKGKRIDSLVGETEGYFPTSYVEIISQPEMLVEVLYDFDPKKVPNLPDSLVTLKVRRNDIVLVTSKHISGWWMGSNIKGGPEGHFPGNYTKCIAEPVTEPINTFFSLYGEPVIEGVVCLRNEVINVFQSMYCYVTNSGFYYFNSHSSDPQKPVGKIDLTKQDTSIVVGKKEGYFSIVCGDKVQECKIDHTALDCWVDLLKSVISGVPITLE